MDIGIWMSPDTLEEKLDLSDSRNPEAAWNMSRWPKGFTNNPGEVNRLFVASEGYWEGYFIISKEMLYLPEDKKTPYVLLFDTRTWTPVPKAAAKRFRGFTYQIPKEITEE